MRRLYILLLLITSPLSLHAQGGNTFITGQVLDPTGVAYVNSQVNISFYDPGTSHKIPLLNGSTFQTQYTVQTDSFGNIPAGVSLPDNGVIGSGSGELNTQWTFRIVYQDRVTSFTTNITINCSTNTPTTCSGNSINLTATLQAAAAPIPGGVNTGNFAIKPSLLNSVQYVSTFGNDSKDGLSWGSAKRTIYKALQSLTGGNTSPPTAGKGTVYLMDGGGTCAGFSSDGVIANSVQAGSVNPYSTSGTGIWIMGPLDPNYANPPTGWLRFSGPISITGIAGSCSQSQSFRAPNVDVAAGAIGGNETSTKPAVWLSGVAGPIQFKDIQFEPAWNGARLGIDSNGVRDSNVGTSSITFDNVGMGVGNYNASAGPTVDIGAGVFWVWFLHCTMSPAILEPVSNDKRANILINSNNAENTGLIYVRDNVWNGGGGIKYYPWGSSSLYVDGLSIEGGSGHGQPGVWLTSAGSGSVSSEFHLIGVMLSDYTDPVVAVQNDGLLSSSQVLVGSSEGSSGMLQGPGTVAGYGSVQSLVTSTVSPALSNQAGFIAGPSSQARIYGQQDTMRRNFTPVASRFTQLASQVPSAWPSIGTSLGTSTFTANVAAPDGTSNAGRLLGVSGCTPHCSINWYSASVTPAVGDWIILGVWARIPPASPRPGGIAQLSSSQITNALEGGAVVSTYLLQSWIKGDGEWNWYSMALKVNTVTGGTGTMKVFAIVDAGMTIDYYAPIFLYLPAGTVSDNEAAETAMHFATYPETAAPGEVSMLRNQYLRIGSTAFAGLGTPANGVFIYCSDCTIANPCAGGGTGALAKRLAGVWVCN